MEKALVVTADTIATSAIIKSQPTNPSATKPNAVPSKQMWLANFRVWVIVNLPVVISQSLTFANMKATTEAVINGNESM